MSWGSARLSQLCQEECPITYGILQPGPHVENGVLYVRPSEIAGGQIDISSVRRTSPEIAGHYKKSVLEEGDILITIVGTIGHIATVPAELSGGNITQSSARIRICPLKADASYVKNFLRSPLARRQYDRHRLGVAVPRLNLHHVRDLEILRPPLAEQKRIARILDAADALRAKRREALAQLDTLLDSVFLDMFGDPVTNPKGWDEFPFGDIAADTRIGLVRSSTEFGWDFDIPYVRMDAVTADGSFCPEKVQYTNADRKEAETFSLQPGDFLFNTRNSKGLVGKVCVFPGPRGWLFNNNLMRVRFSSGIESAVILMQFRFRRVQGELEKRKSGTTSVFAVYWKSLRTLPVLVPPSNLQRRFARLVESVEQHKALQRAHLAELDTLFASLQSRAFQGDL